MTHDGPRLGEPDTVLPRILDNLIAQKRVPAMVAVMIQNGGGDAQGRERGLEYDTMSGKFAEFIEAEVLPAVEKNYGVKLTRKGKDRAAMGCSSGAAAAFTMAWYHPEWYHRVISYSGTFVNQQWPFNPATPGGAWDYHERHHRRTAPVKPIRIWMHVGDRDLYNPNVDARRHARLGGGQPPHGGGAQGEGLPLPVRLRARLGALRSPGARADAAGGARIRLAVGAKVGLQSRLADAIHALAIERACAALPASRRNTRFDHRLVRFRAARSSRLPRGNMNTRAGTSPRCRCSQWCGSPWSKRPGRHWHPNWWDRFPRSARAAVRFSLRNDEANHRECLAKKAKTSAWCDPMTVP